MDIFFILYDLTIECWLESIYFFSDYKKQYHFNDLKQIECDDIKSYSPYNLKRKIDRLKVSKNSITNKLTNSRLSIKRRNWLRHLLKSIDCRIDNKEKRLQELNI